ncbi:MAG: hypothetical protein ABH873_01910 [Candidatus Firestonebacteria bacterium]
MSMVVINKFLIFLLKNNFVIGCKYYKTNLPITNFLRFINEGKPTRANPHLR